MKNSNQFEQEVLFQKVGSRWYVFAEINNELVYCALPVGMSPRTSKVEIFHVLEAETKKTTPKARKRSAVAEAA